MGRRARPAESPAGFHGATSIVDRHRSRNAIYLENRCGARRPETLRRRYLHYRPLRCNKANCIGAAMGPRQLVIPPFSKFHSFIEAFPAVIRSSDFSIVNVIERE